MIGAGVGEGLPHRASASGLFPTPGPCAWGGGGLARRGGSRLSKAGPRPGPDTSACRRPSLACGPARDDHKPVTPGFCAPRAIDQLHHSAFLTSFPSLTNDEGRTHLAFGGEGGREGEGIRLVGLSLLWGTGWGAQGWRGVLVPRADGEQAQSSKTSWSPQCFSEILKK